MNLFSTVRSWLSPEPPPVQERMPEPSPAPLVPPPSPLPSRIPRPEMEIDLEELRRVVLSIGQDARARERDERNPFDPSKLTPPPGFAKSADSAMAMDEVAGVSQWAVEGIAGFLGPREGFIGYPELTLLSQIPEYRSPVEIIATEATRKWIKFTSKGDADKGKKIAEIEDEFKRLEVQARFHQVSRYDGFYGRGHIYLDVGTDLNDRKELLKPIGAGDDGMSKAKIGKGALRELRVIEPVWCWPGNYNSTNPIDPTWYRPRTWNVMSTEVDKTRLLTFISREVGDLLKPAYMFGGQSLTQVMRPVVENWLSTRAAVGEIVKRFSHNVIKVNLTEAINSGNAAKMFLRAKLFNETKGNFGTMLLDKETEDFINVSIPLGGLDLLQAQAQEHNCSLSRIPQIKLLGIQPAGLNATSEGELRAFEEMIHSYQESFFRPNLQTVLNLVQLSLFGDVDKDIGFEFESLTAELDEKERAEAGRQALDGVAGAYSEGLYDRAAALRQIQTLFESLGIACSITPQMITEAENEPPRPSPEELTAEAEMVKAEGEARLQ
jgi:uncharacterized protein